MRHHVLSSSERVTVLEWCAHTECQQGRGAGGQYTHCGMRCPSSGRAADALGAQHLPRIAIFIRNILFELIFMSRHFGILVQKVTQSVTNEHT